MIFVKQNKDMARMPSVTAQRKACRAAVCVFTEAAGIESYIMQARSGEIYWCANVSGPNYQKQNYASRQSMKALTISSSSSSIFHFCKWLLYFTWIDCGLMLSLIPVRYPRGYRGWAIKLNEAADYKQITRVNILKGCFSVLWSLWIFHQKLNVWGNS